MDDPMPMHLRRPPLEGAPPAVRHSRVRSGHSAKAHNFNLLNTR
jgi:hypothetical protein